MGFLDSGVQDSGCRVETAEAIGFRVECGWPREHWGAPPHTSARAMHSQLEHM